MGSQTIPASAQTVDLGCQRLVAAAVINQRREQFDLLLGFQHGLMGAIEIIEVADQGLQSRANLEGFKHMAAHEIRQVTHGLHRHRLVEQFQRLIVFNAEAPTEPCRIGWKAIVQFSAKPAQLLAQLGNVRPEM